MILVAVGSSVVIDTPHEAARAPAHEPRRLRRVGVAWDALRSAFQDTTPGVRSYLELSTGKVLRLVDGVADPGEYDRVERDADHVRIRPVTPHGQYLWMQEFISSLQDPGLAASLVHAIHGRKAFRSFRDALRGHEAERERWLAFHGARVRSAITAWMGAHGLEPVPLPPQRPEDTAIVTEPRPEGEGPRAAGRADLLWRLEQAARDLPPRDCEALLALAEHLHDLAMNTVAPPPSTSTPCAPRPPPAHADDPGRAEPTRAPPLAILPDPT